MRYYDYNIVLQEVPNEVSLSLSITGCKLSCDGCHSPYLWKEHGEILTNEIFTDLLNKYTGLISCVLFMGGEWHEEELVNLLSLSKSGLVVTLELMTDGMSRAFLIGWR